MWKKFVSVQTVGYYGGRESPGMCAGIRVSQRTKTHYISDTYIVAGRAGFEQESGGPYPFKKSNEFRKLRTRDLAEARRHAAPNPTHWPASFGPKRARPI